jgi:DNA primase
MGFAIMVEGQVDVQLMHAYGFGNTVGLMGSAFTPMQAHLLLRWTEQVVLMMDGDQPGKDSAEKAREILNYFQGTGRRNFKYVKYAIVDMPTKEDLNDPAKFLRARGSLEMRKMIANSMALAGLTIPDGMFPEEGR